MSYKEKIDRIYNEIGQLGKSLLNYIKEEHITDCSINNSDEFYKITSEQAINIEGYIKDINSHIKEFNYYTEFYVNKDEVENYIKNISILLKYINKIEIGESSIRDNPMEF